MCVRYRCLVSKPYKDFLRCLFMTNNLNDRNLNDRNIIIFPVCYILSLNECQIFKGEEELSLWNFRRFSLKSPESHNWDTTPVTHWNISVHYRGHKAPIMRTHRGFICSHWWMKLLNLNISPNVTETALI